MNWSFYNPADGSFTGGSFSGPAAYLAANIPEGCAAIEGQHDHLCKRVDLETGEVVDWQPPAPADSADCTHEWSAEARRWVAIPTLARLLADAHAAIDQAAGSARLRFITDVPGQQAVYLMKLQEARALLADPVASAPHIVAEAAATGQLAAATAQAIVDRATLWNVALSPAIEGARLGAKAAVSAAATPEALAAALAAGIATLNAITA